MNDDLFSRLLKIWSDSCEMSDDEFLRQINEKLNEKHTELPKDVVDECRRTVQMFMREKQQNNGDKLRSMTNEQLARYLWIESDRMTPEEWLDWLNAT